jgi:hypothetical protein
VLHFCIVERTDERNQATAVDGLDVIQVYCGLVLDTFLDPIGTSLGAPRRVDVTGATITVCRSGMTSCRERINTGRRLSGPLNR